MAKTSYLGANIAVSTDTFREWVERTNQLVSLKEGLRINC